MRVLRGRGLYPYIVVADGRTGRLTQGAELASRKKLPAWAAYGEPMIHRFTGKENADVLLDSPYILALLDTNGTPVWHGPGRADYPSNEGNVGQTTSIKHALVDFAEKHPRVHHFRGKRLEKLIGRYDRPEGTFGNLRYRIMDNAQL